tara:strand:+ start:240 stop:461 length:222 start_codon:yes stop_codon:yes gene_type:complete
MKTKFLLFKNVINLLPYFLFVAIYFYFISIEARKDHNINEKKENGYELPKKESKFDDKQFKIKIPVVPYKNKF